MAALELSPSWCAAVPPKGIALSASSSATTAGDPIGFTMISRDLTESERIERELRDSQEYNRGLIESNIDALMTTDPLGTITDVNRQMCEMAGALALLHLFQNRKIARIPRLRDDVKFLSHAPHHGVVNVLEIRQP